VGCAFAAVALRIWNHGLDISALPSLTSGAWAIDVLGALAWCIPGWLIARRRPDLPFGWLAFVAAAGHALSALGLQLAVAQVLGGHELKGASWGLWLTAWGPAAELPVLAVIYVLFPDGRRAAGRLGRLSMVGVTIVSVGLVLSALESFRSVYDIKGGPFGHVRNPLTGADGAGLPPGVPFIAVGMLAVSVTVLVRWRTGNGRERIVLRGLALLAAAAPFVVAAVLVLPAKYGFAVGEIETFLEIAVITATVLRHQLFGIEVALRRFAVYGTLVMSIALAHGALAALVTSFTTRSTAATVAAVGVALAVLPARDGLNRVVTRLLYGARDEPITVLSAVSHTSAAVLDPNDLLRQIAVNVADAMRLPYVAIEVADDAASFEAHTGRRGTVQLEEFPLVHQGRQLGVLRSRPRSGETVLSARDSALLEQVAEQAAVAVAAMLMGLDAQRSRERLVVAVEDERRRLRRDLHDGLGPSLTASTLRLDAARVLLAAQPDEADSLIAAVRDDVAEALTDIRRLVYDLRPPAIDDLGLVGALRRHFDVPSQDGLKVLLLAPEVLPTLSAAVEVSAYRIVAEAVTNVRRHSGARRCTVRICAEDDLRIEVTDDGTRAGPWLPGVGLTAMAERAAEVGGWLDAGPTVNGGRVAVGLPLAGSQS
jgi:signal transduction histidine kinase